jgi:uncharacterized phage protein (TIGR02220 family)
MNVVPLKTENPLTQIEQATLVIDFLNAKTGKKFSARNPRGNPTANADFILARFREGYTVQDCKSVIALKCREWLHDEKMSKFLTPETLFRRSNFERYIGEIGPEDAE